MHDLLLKLMATVVALFRIQRGLSRFVRYW